jgi:hypothetical protein
MCQEKQGHKRLLRKVVVARGAGRCMSGAKSHCVAVFRRRKPRIYPFLFPFFRVSIHFVFLFRQQRYNEVLFPQNIQA